MIVNGQAIAAVIFFRTECAIQMIGTVCHMNTVLVQEKIIGTALHSHYIQKICDPFCNVAGHIGLDTIIDFLFQPVFIVHNAVDCEKSSVYRNHGIVPEKFFTENDFVDCFAVKPNRHIRIRQFPVL